jgi:hypothetical protein
LHAFRARSFVLVSRQALRFFRKLIARSAAAMPVPTFRDIRMSGVAGL